MADALCGPSNPLQQFKQQTQLDRTIQQDRLTSRHSPAQGFRTPDPNAGLLDPEFEAFQAGVPISELPHLQPFQHQPPPFAGSSAQAPSWAEDFQRMHISPPPAFHQQHAPQAPPADWAQGFREHIAQSAPRAKSSSPSPLAFQQRARYGYNGFQSQFAQPQQSFASPMQSKGKEPVQEQFDDAAFERAFDQATRELAEQEAQVQHSSMREQDIMEVNEMESTLKDGLQSTDTMTSSSLDAGAHPLDNFDFDSFLPNTGDTVFSDAMETHTENEPTRQEEDDALAATAQELLEKVEHNQTDKFRNSQFLGLMRKLRDREVKVDGDKMVETNAASSSSTSAVHETPLNGTSFSSIPRFDNSEQRPTPLDDAMQNGVATASRPLEHGIPAHEQDHDAGRVDPNDGQAVVDLLNERGAINDDIGTSSPALPRGRAPFYADLRPVSGESGSVSEMLYGASGTLTSPFASSRTQTSISEEGKHGLRLNYFD